ncbi:unnamed protein product [Gadus morhua 'NCC']
MANMSQDRLRTRSNRWFGSANAHGFLSRENVACRRRINACRTRPPSRRRPTVQVSTGPPPLPLPNFPSTIPLLSGPRGAPDASEADKESGLLNEARRKAQCHLDGIAS